TVRTAWGRLAEVPAAFPGRRETLSDAHVTAAWALHFLGARKRAKDHLRTARRTDPRRSTEDALYLYVSGETEPFGQPRLRLLREAVEMEPRFEVAQFELAYACEMLWRSHPRLQRSDTKQVAREYDKILDLNPGDLGAGANLGYTYWLLGDMNLEGDTALQTAQDYLNDGREYKDFHPATFVSELDYGLARIAAEQGHL